MPWRIVAGGKGCPFEVVRTDTGKPVDDAAPEEVARVREALRGDLGKPLCGHLTGQRWAGCAPESLRCWINR
jgi:hypothetical protein